MNNLIKKILNERKLTAAELAKREEVAKAIEKDQPGIDMSKKMAIATSVAKKVAEEQELEELSKDTLNNYTARVSADSKKTYAYRMINHNKKDDPIIKK
jgi:DNA-binding XRE family transcriptional regulator